MQLLDRHDRQTLNYRLNRRTHPADLLDYFWIGRQPAARPPTGRNRNMTNPTLSVPLDRYLSLADLLSQASLDSTDAGNDIAAAQHGMACGAILTLLIDFGLIDSQTLQPLA